MDSDVCCIAQSDNLSFNSQLSGDLSVAGGGGRHASSGANPRKQNSKNQTSHVIRSLLFSLGLPRNFTTVALENRGRGSPPLLRTAARFLSLASAPCLTLLLHDVFAAPGKGVVEFLVGNKRSNYSTPVYLFIVFLVSVVLWGVMPWIISAYAELNLEERVALLEQNGGGGGSGSGAALSASAMQELQKLKSEVAASLEAMKGVKAEVEGKIKAFTTAQASDTRHAATAALLSPHCACDDLTTHLPPPPGVHGIGSERGPHRRDSKPGQTRGRDGSNRHRLQCSRQVHRWTRDKNRAKRGEYQRGPQLALRPREEAQRRQLRDRRGGFEVF